jgi:hypothetical protein
MKIFWSWQSDRYVQTGQYFVRDALKEAAKQLSREHELTEADRLEIDHDTKGVPGTPPIVETIFNKIEEAAVFVADVTPVGVSDGGKLLPNPNVMIELGYARRAKGHERIILVCNSQYLARPEDLPFDLRGDRGPTQYNLPPDADPATRKAAEKMLVHVLKPKLADILSYEARQQAVAKLTAPALEADTRSIWFDTNYVQSHVDSFTGATRLVRLQPGPYSFMRITPSEWPTVRRSALDPSRHGRALATGRSCNGDWGQTSDGLLSYWFAEDGDVRIADAMTQWFADTGIVWAVWGGVVSEAEPRWFYGQEVMRYWGQFLFSAITRLVALGARPPFRVDAGVAGIARTRWAQPGTVSPMVAARPEMRISSTAVSAELATQNEFLASLFNRLTDAFGFADEITHTQVNSIVGPRDAAS